MRMTGLVGHGILCFLLPIVALAPGAWAVPHTVASPDGQVTISVGITSKDAPHDPDRRVYYNVSYKGQPLLLDSAFGLEFKDMPPLATELRVASVGVKESMSSWQRVWGKSKNVVDHYEELRLTLKESRDPGRTVELVFRAYDDGVAFRYVLPEQPGFSDFQLINEHCEFQFSQDHRVWALDLKKFTSNYEGMHLEKTLSELSGEGLYGCPLLVEAGDGAWVALTESALTDWAGIYYVPRKERPYTLRAVFSPLPGAPDVLVRSTTPRKSPWRTILIGDTPGALIESNLISNLNEPCAIADPSWIEPGMCAWDRWWCGSYAPDLDFTLGVDNKSMKYFVDFAGEMGWEYMLVDWEWYGKPFTEGAGSPYNPEADITTPIPGMDIPELVQYAAKQGVKIIIWLQWESADKQMDKAFPLYEQWGVAGVKIDFMDRDDQEMVNYYHLTTMLAAKHHLLVDFHGSYKPTGWSRTYPDLITREGVLGNEHNKWSRAISPDYCLTIPYTRMLAGPMDFTPGGFHNRSKENFKVVGGPGPHVMGTRCFQLAMFVVYDSPLQVLADSPYTYRNSPAGLDFLKIVPTTWDETRVLKGEVGDYIAMARRSGDTWYLAAMTDWDPRELKLDLDFLGPGKFNAEIWQDGKDADENAEDLLKDHKVVKASTTLRAPMASGGGYIAVLAPKG